MSKIRLTEPGFTTLTGFIGTIEFVDGVSISHVSEFEGIRLGSSVRIERISDEDGSGKQVGAAQLIVDNYNMEAPFMGDSERAEAQSDDGQSKTETEVVFQDDTPPADGFIGDANDDITKIKLKSMPAQTTDIGEIVKPSTEPGSLKYNEAALAKIADIKGAIGLREIAVEFGVKGRSIRELISGISNSPKNRV